MDHTSRIVQVEHIRMWTGTPFAEVVRRIEAETGVFAPVAAMRARIEAKAPSAPAGKTDRRDPFSDRPSLDGFPDDEAAAEFPRNVTDADMFHRKE